VWPEHLYDHQVLDDSNIMDFRSLTERILHEINEYQPKLKSSSRNNLLQIEESLSRCCGRLFENMYRNNRSILFNPLLLHAPLQAPISMFEVKKNFFSLFFKHLYEDGEYMKESHIEEMEDRVDGSRMDANYIQESHTEEMVNNETGGREDGD